MRKPANWLLVCAILSSVFQLLWFGAMCWRQINYDGMAYVGIARELRQGYYFSAINGFRSPLISWLIALGSFLNSDYQQIGKIVTLGTYFTTGCVLYILTERLWHSKLASSAAVLVFSFSRGLAVAAVASVTPDFLFATITLLYFIVLLRCVSDGRIRSWVLLGALHGLAFLAKAFALPWMAVSTLLAVLLSKQPRRISRLGVAAVTPVLVAGLWGLVLHSKYGTFTTGTQFKVNFLQWTLKAYRNHRSSTYALLTDTAQQIDQHGVDDPMPPRSWPWNYHIGIRQAAWPLLQSEVRIVPAVLKELIILVTPGGFLAFLFSVRDRFSLITAASAISLIVAYSMMVFDTRYLFPLVPIVLALGAYRLVQSRILVGLSCLGVLVYCVMQIADYGRPHGRV